MKKFISFVLILMLLSTQVYANDDIEIQEKILEDIEEKLNSLDSSHRVFVDQKNSMIRNIRSLEDSVRTTEEEIVKLNGDIQTNVVLVGNATLELSAAKQALKETNDLLDQRIRIMYMNGTIGYLEVILESSNFEDLLTRVEMLKRIVESDTSLIDQMEIDKQHVDDKKTALEEEQAKLVALEEALQDKKVKLTQQIEEYVAQKSALESDIAALEIQIDETNKDAEAIKTIIADQKLRAQYVGGEMTWPVPSSHSISSYFGMRRHPILNVDKLHTGIDIRGDKMQVVAAQEGRVIWSNWLSSYGKCIMIDHGGGIVTVYAHNSSLIVQKGQDVVRGQKIALTGSTGNVTGPHLHFEVRKDGDYVDPRTYVEGN